MSTFSKFFEDHIKPGRCQDIGIHSTSCKKHFIRNLLPYLLSNLKYFVPICLLPALINIQNINKNKLRKTLQYYLSCTIFGFCNACVINCLICTLRNIRGEFGYYSFVFIPSVLSAYMFSWAPERTTILFETTIFQSTLENFFLMRKNFLSRSIANSKLIQTGLFMICSGIILHAKQLYNAKGFWLLNPNPQVASKENTEDLPKCELHPQNTCKQYLFEGMRKYFILGLSLDLIKMLMSQVDLKQNPSKLFAKLKNFRIQSMALLTAYIGIYRLANCWFNREGYFTNSYNHFLSSFMAGSCYYLYPQSSLFSFGLVQAIRSSWEILEATKSENQNKIVKMILSIPYGKILYPFALGNLVHLLVLYPQYTSPLSATVGNAISNNYPKHAANQINLLKAKYM